MQSECLSNNDIFKMCQLCWMNYSHFLFNLMNPCFTILQSEGSVTIAQSVKQIKTENNRISKTAVYKEMGSN